jgi:hypothetical protein
VRGVQGLAAVNVAGEVRGAQLGLYNQATDIAGIQVGVVNLSRRATTAFGLINVAEEATAPVGLVNVIGNGYRRVGTWGGAPSLASLGAKLGGTALYTAYGVSLLPRSPQARFAATTGLGWHLGNGRVFVDTELLGSMLFTETGVFQHRALLGTLRAQLGVQLWRTLALTAGPAVNAFVGWDGQDLELTGGPQWTTRASGSTVHLFPGWQVGVQL